MNEINKLLILNNEAGSLIDYINDFEELREQYKPKEQPKQQRLQKKTSDDSPYREKGTELFEVLEV